MMIVPAGSRGGIIDQLAMELRRQFRAGPVSGCSSGGNAAMTRRAVGGVVAGAAGGSSRYSRPALRRCRYSPVAAVCRCGSPQAGRWQTRCAWPRVRHRRAEYAGRGAGAAIAGSDVERRNRRRRHRPGPTRRRVNRQAKGRAQDNARRKRTRRPNTLNTALFCKEDWAGKRQQSVKTRVLAAEQRKTVGTAGRG